MFQLSFWKDAAERALKTAAQFVLAAWGFTLDAVQTVLPDVPVATSLDWKGSAQAALVGAVLSLLFSIVSAPFGDRGDASLINT